MGSTSAVDTARATTRAATTFRNRLTCKVVSPARCPATGVATLRQPTSKAAGTNVEGAEKAFLGSGRDMAQHLVSHNDAGHLLGAVRPAGSKRPCRGTSTNRQRRGGSWQARLRSLSKNFRPRLYCDWRRMPILLRTDHAEGGRFQ